SAIRLPARDLSPPSPQLQSSGLPLPELSVVLQRQAQLRGPSPVPHVQLLRKLPSRRPPEPFAPPRPPCAPQSGSLSGRQRLPGRLALGKSRIVQLLAMPLQQFL